MEARKEQIESLRIKLRGRARDLAEEAKPIFEVKDWTYFDSQEPPTVSRLADTIRSIINSLKAGHSSYAVASGRFQAKYEVHQDTGHVYGTIRMTSPKYRTSV